MYSVNNQIVAFTIVIITFLLFLLFKNIDLSEEFCTSNELLCLIWLRYFLNIAKIIVKSSSYIILIALVGYFDYTL
jgi:hypothetical protein